MSEGKRHVPILFLAWSMAASICSCGQVPAAEAGDTKALIEDGKVVVAKVNGKSIYEGLLNQQVELAIQKYKKYGMRAPSADLLRVKREQALNQLVDDALLRQAAETVDVPDMEARINKKIEETKKGPRGASLKGRGDAELREWAQGEILLNEYLERNGIARPAVPEQDIRGYYEKNQASFMRKEAVKVRHILVKAGKDAKPEEVAAARKEIEKARQRILGGKDFAEVARESSGCDSAAAGGDLGYVEKGFMPPEFDAVAFSLKPGKLSEIFQTEFGYHVLEVIDRKPEGVVPYEEIKGFIEKFLQGDLRRNKLLAHIQDLRGKAKIEIFMQ